jgi:hypothetical protein
MVQFTHPTGLVDVFPEWAVASGPQCGTSKGSGTGVACNRKPATGREFRREVRICLALSTRRRRSPRHQRGCPAPTR